MIKHLSILGSTGSIGRQALDVARILGIKITALSAKDNIKLLEEQIREFKPEFAVVYDINLAKKLKENVGDIQVNILSGMDGLCEIASIKSDMVLNSVSGMIGLIPTMRAIEAKNDIAIANKETLVVGGDLVIDAAKSSGVNIIPVDSEHSAIFQCLQGCKDIKLVKNLILTASGGPFFGKSQKDLENATIEQALSHPNWHMGNKITIDSATMMNKGLEIIEAVRLFRVPQERIKVLIHRQSIVHSMVEYNDNSIIAQLGTPDMRIPIQYAFTYPERVLSCAKALDLTNSSLDFYEPDKNQLKCINLCREAIHSGGNKPTILNAANEEAVQMFLNSKIRFLEIPQIVEDAMKNIRPLNVSNVKDIINVDLETRDYVRNHIL